MGAGVGEPVRVPPFIDLDLISEARCRTLTESVQVARTVNWVLRGHLTMSLVCEGPVQGDDAAFESHLFVKMGSRTKDGKEADCLGFLKGWKEKQIYLCTCMFTAFRYASTPGSIADCRVARATSTSSRDIINI